MRAWLQIARLSRPAVAVAALYALVLGTLLGSLGSLPHLAPGQHALCSPASGGSSVPFAPDAGHGECCTLACPGGASFAPPPLAGYVPPDRTVSTLKQVLSRVERPAGPALRDIRSRGPPLA